MTSRAESRDANHYATEAPELSIHQFSRGMLNRPRHHDGEAYKAARHFPLVNDCDSLAGFSDFYLPLSHLTPSTRGSLRAIGFVFGTGKLEWQRSHDDRLSRLGTIHQRDRHTDRQTDRPPR